MITLKINRGGSFSVIDESETANQCGSVGRRHYQYFVTIEATDKVLTPEGYVMENKWTDDYFQDTYNEKKMKCDSCELMACRAIEAFRKLFATIPELQQVDLKRIYVRIHGSDVSFIEAEWNG